MKVAQLEAEVAKEKELAAETQIGNRVLKEASANQKKYEADLKSLKHDLEVSEAQKQRLLVNQDALLSAVQTIQLRFLLLYLHLLCPRPSLQFSHLPPQRISLLLSVYNAPFVEDQ